MDATTLLSTIYDAITREKVGVLAILTALVTLVKTYREKNKLKIEIAKLKEDILESRQRRALGYVQAQKAAMELRALKKHHQEISQWLSEIEQSITDLYNELDAAFSHLTREIAKRDLTKRIDAMYDFANTRRHRPKLERAAASLRRLTEEHPRPGISALIEQITEFERSLTCRDFDLRAVEDELRANKGLSAQKWDQIESWVAQLRRLHDQLIPTIGDIRAWLTLDLEAA